MKGFGVAILVFDSSRFINGIQYGVYSKINNHNVINNKLLVIYFSTLSAAARPLGRYNRLRWLCWGLPNLGQLVSHNGAWGRAPRESGVPS
jgi:hypothetical protein